MKTEGNPTIWDLGAYRGPQPRVSLVEVHGENCGLRGTDPALQYKGAKKKKGEEAVQNS